MPEVASNADASEAAESFYSGALIRITRLMPVLALAGTAAAARYFGWRIALGFALGCAIAYLNFHWLKRVVTALADKATQSGAPASSKGVVARFLLRYLLMGLGGYAIFTVSPASLYGLLAGLFLPVAAIACETVYEAYAALVRGI
jgi:ATP synthase I chain